MLCSRTLFARCRLPYGRWKKVTTNFESLPSFGQEQVPRNYKQITLFAYRTVWNNAKRPNTAAATVIQKHGSKSRSRQIQSCPSKRAKKIETKKPSHNPLDEPLPLFAMSVYHKKAGDTFPRVGAIASVMHGLPAILDTGAEPNYLRENQLTQVLKSQVILETTTTKIHEESDKPLHIIGRLKSYIHVGQ